LALLQGLTANPNYILDPVEKAWALQQDIECEQK